VFRHKDADELADYIKRLKDLGDVDSILEIVEDWSGVDTNTIEGRRGIGSEIPWRRFEDRPQIFRRVDEGASGKLKAAARLIYERPIADKELAALGLSRCDFENVDTSTSGRRIFRPSGCSMQWERNGVLARPVRSAWITTCCR